MSKIAWFSPLPPTRSGIADYSRDLLPFLRETAAITAYTSLSTRNTITDLVPVRPISAYPDHRWEHDIPVYHIGNNPHHTDIIAMHRRYPGIVVLHDVILHHLMASDREQYWRELAYTHGNEGVSLFYTAAADYFAMSLNQRILDLALGCIVHSQFAADTVRATHPQLPCAVIPMAVPLPLPTINKQSKQFVFGMVGQVTPTKQLELCLEAFDKVNNENKNARFVIVGEAIDVDVAELIAGRENVTWHGYIDDFARFQQVVGSIDVVLNLREPTVGETSAAALRALAQGKPVIVFDHAWYSELPDDVAIKLRVGDVPALVAGMHSVMGRVDEMSSAARSYVERVHDPVESAAQYLSFIQMVAS